VQEFVKRTSLVRCDARSLRRIGPAAITLAEAEGLTGHAESVRVRLRAATT
jgi:histidinol dehydrogenase